MMLAIGARFHRTAVSVSEFMLESWPIIGLRYKIEPDAGTV